MSTENLPGVTGAEVQPSGGSDPETPNPWNVIRSWFFNRHEPKADYGTGYYVKSDVHPVVGGPEMTLDEIYGALKTVTTINAAAIRSAEDLATAGPPDVQPKAEE